MAWLPDWRISLLSLAWLLTGVGISIGLATAGYRSSVSERHAAAWGWLAFVSGSQVWALRRLQLGSRCGMSYEDVALTILFGAALGGLCAAAAFVLVRARRWGGSRSTALAALLAALLTLVFFAKVVAFWLSDACFPRDFEI
jgi:hypothetical protein